MKKVLVGIVLVILTAFGVATTAVAQDNDCPANALDAIRNWGTFDAIPTACLKAKQVVALAAPKPAPTVNPTVLKGDSPATARDIAGTWENIEPGQSIWYKTSSQFFRILDLYLETNVSGIQGKLGMSVYSPDQIDELWANKPVGRGTPFKPNPNQLNWKSDYAKAGAWHIQITNYSSTPLPYKFTLAESDTPQKNCWGYWETLPNGEYVYWIDCGRYTTVPGSK